MGKRRTSQPHSPKRPKRVRLQRNVRLVESSVEDEDDIPMEVDGKNGPSEVGRKDKGKGRRVARVSDNSPMEVDRHESRIMRRKGEHVAEVSDSSMEVDRHESRGIRKKGKGKQVEPEVIDADESVVCPTPDVHELIKNGHFLEARKLAFSEGAQKMLNNVRSNWKETVPEISEMPNGWPYMDLASGLEPEHIYPSFYKLHKLAGRDIFGAISK
ncbi:hypothetical protein BYT27DRAFT_7214882 [Phlegmacium glaucopus]|nr:hypothetical protein BYT27DRAFT_7214882 [Phlegmacium glaucopus]